MNRQHGPERSHAARSPQNTAGADPTTRAGVSGRQRGAQRVSVYSQMPPAARRTTRAAATMLTLTSIGALAAHLGGAIDLAPNAAAPLATTAIGVGVLVALRPRRSV